MKKKSKAYLPAVAPMYIFTIFFVAMPLLYVLYMSFMTRDDIWGYVNKFTFDNYKRIFDPNYLKVLTDSVELAFITTLLTLLIGYPFAYFMAKLKPVARNIVLFLVIVPFWTNALVRMYGWMILLSANGVINNTLLHFGIISIPIKFLYTYGAVLLGMLYFLLPFMLLPIHTSILKLDWSVVEAARDLGASAWKTFWTVTIPLTMPGIMSGCILVFIPSIGLFFISDIMGGGKLMLSGNLIKNELLVARDWPFGAALSIIMLILMLSFIWLYRKVTGQKDLEAYQ
jgi:spermidine/putrescine transport system permease protein